MYGRSMGSLDVAAMAAARAGLEGSMIHTRGLVKLPARTPLAVPYWR
jgi:hypothetical protein